MYLAILSFLAIFLIILFGYLLNEMFKKELNLSDTILPNMYKYREKIYNRYFSIFTNTGYHILGEAELWRIRHSSGKWFYEIYTNTAEISCNFDDITVKTHKDYLKFLEYCKDLKKQDTEKIKQQLK
jgi:hypothetical protein